MQFQFMVVKLFTKSTFNEATIKKKKINKIYPQQQKQLNKQTSKILDICLFSRNFKICSQIQFYCCFFFFLRKLFKRFNSLKQTRNPTTEASASVRKRYASW